MSARSSGGCLPDDTGISEPSVSLPSGGTSVGGANSMCSEPSRLVWPMVAVALAGSSTSPSRVIVSSACQPWRSIFVTLPTVTSPTCTREFGSRLLTSGSCAWMVYEPGPPPAVPGSCIELRPRQPQPANAVRTPAVSRTPRRGAPCRGPAPRAHGPTSGRHHHSAQPVGRIRWSAPRPATAAHSRRRAGIRRRRNVVRPHPVLAVGDLVRPRHRADDQVFAEGREVVLPVLDDRRQILDTPFRRLLRRPSGTPPVSPRTGTVSRIGEVVVRLRTAQRALGRLVDVHEVLQFVRGDVQCLLEVVEAGVQCVGNGGQLVRRRAQRLAVVGHEALHVADDDR